MLFSGNLSIAEDLLIKDNQVVDILYSYQEGYKKDGEDT